MKVFLRSHYQCAALCSSPTFQRVQFCLFATTSSANNYNNMPPPKIEDAFAVLRSNPKQIFLLDGGTGEEIFRRNVPDDRKIWSATALVHPQYHNTLEDVHTAFLQSGSNAITTNSYGVVPGVGFDEHEISKYTDLSGKIARSAAQKHYVHSSSPTFVFGSLGPLVESYRPDKIMPHDEGVKCYKHACQSLAPHIDAFLAETMSCVEESIQVLDAVASSPGDVESTGQQRRSLLISYSLDPQGNFRDGEEILDGIRRILEQAKKHRSRVQCKVLMLE